MAHVPIPAQESSPTPAERYDVGDQIGPAVVERITRSYWLDIDGVKWLVFWRAAYTAGTFAWFACEVVDGRPQERTYGGAFGWSSIGHAVESLAAVVEDRRKVKG